MNALELAISDGLKTRQAEVGKVSIERLATELDFRRALPRLVKIDFDVAIFDVMVGWCMTEDAVTPEGSNPPPEVLEELALDKRWRSGVRCRRKCHGRNSS